MMLFPADRQTFLAFLPSWPELTAGEEGASSGALGRRPTTNCLVRLLASLSIFAALSASPVLAGSSSRAPSPESTNNAVTNSAPAAKPAHEPSPRRMTKFEARKIRHACYGRADERSLSGAEREAFLARCYFGRVSHRAERQQCRQQAAAQGFDKSAARDFVRECVKERVRQKEGKAVSE